MRSIFFQRKEDPLLERRLSIFWTEKSLTKLSQSSAPETRIQEERFPSQEEANRYRGGFRISQAIYDAHCKPSSVLMHPLPRDSRSDANELDNDLNNNDNLAIFRQVQNGVLIRMALFALTLGVENQVEKYEVDVPWFSRKRDS